MPLIFSSLERIDKISIAMELRAFGNSNKRTWYKRKDFTKNDYITIILFALIVLLSIILVCKSPLNSTLPLINSNFSP